MAVTGHGFLVRRVSGIVVASTDVVVIDTVPALRNWEAHTFSFTALFAVGVAGTFHFEISDSAGANFEQIGPRFSKVSNARVQYNLDTDRVTQSPGTPIAETTDAKYVTNFKGLKMVAGQVIRVVDLAGVGDEILDATYMLTGIEEILI